jgi:hypothetical protein
MKAENKNKQMAQKIIDILQGGLTLNADTNLRNCFRMNPAVKLIR